MLKIIFLPSVNKPDAKLAAKMLAPIVRDIWQKQQDEKLLSSNKKTNQPHSGDSVV